MPLVRGRLDPTGLEQRGRVEQRPTLPMRVAEQHGQRRLAGDLCDTRLAGIKKVLAQQQVLGRVASQRQFRREQKVGALRGGLARGGEDAVGVAGEVADRRVDLGKGDAHGVASVAKPAKKAAAAAHTSWQVMTTAHQLDDVFVQTVFWTLLRRAINTLRGSHP